MLLRSWKTDFTRNGAKICIVILVNVDFLSLQVEYIYFLVLCVNRKVSVHQAENFTAEAADAVYHHEMNFIRHDHDCFCHCGGQHND